MSINSRSTIEIKKSTKERLYQNRALGQCYDGFICQFVDLWEKIKTDKQDYLFNDLLNGGKGGDA